MSNGISIAVLEKNENWKATAKLPDGKLVAVMKGQRGSPREHSFYLYPDNWVAPPAPTGVTASEPHSLKEIKAMFASGKLTIVKGEIPKE